MKEIALKMTTLPKQNPSRPRIVVITQGHLPVILANGRFPFFPVLMGLKERLELTKLLWITRCLNKNLLFVVEGKTTEYPVDLVPADKVVDTNGAGDAFVGGKSLLDFLTSNFYQPSQFVIIISVPGFALALPVPEVAADVPCRA